MMQTTLLVRPREALLGRVELSLPGRVWKDCLTGTATVTVRHAQDWSVRGMNVRRFQHSLPQGLHTLYVSSPWYQAETDVEVADDKVTRVVLRERDFDRREVTSFRLSREQALMGSRGGLWVRLLEGPGLVPVASGHSIDLVNGNSFRVAARGPLRRLFLEIAAPGCGRTVLALALENSRGGVLTGWVNLRRQGRSLTFAARPHGTGLVNAATALERGAVEYAADVVMPMVQEFRAGHVPRGYEAALVAYLMVRAGRFEALMPWAQRLVDDQQCGADACAAVAEWYAEAGCHVSALNLLARLPSIDPPLLSGSYALATARLSAYASAVGSDPSAYAARLQVARSREDSNRMDRLFSQLAAEDADLPVPHLRGQQLDSWDRQVARDSLGVLRERIAQVDWSQHLLQFRTDDRRRLPEARYQLGRGPRRVVESVLLRLQPGWRSFTWTFDPNRRPIRGGAVEH